MLSYIDSSVLENLKPRPADSDKSTFGTLLTLCGCEYMTGAFCLSATSALRSGVGLLRAAGSVRTVKRLQRILYEPVYLDVKRLTFERSNAFLCGCGIGRTYDKILKDILEKCNIPAVLDADCINFLAMNKDVLGRISCEKILTPHLYEMSRLTGIAPDGIKKDRVKIASDFAVNNNCVLVLKGKNTVVADKNGDVFINTSGNNSLSKGGSGDVLAGLIASLLAQGHSPINAAKIGVFVHGKAGENLSEKFGARYVLPSDLPKEISEILG